MLSSCLVPPPLEAVPRPDNRPPRIRPESLEPSPTIEPQTLPAGCPEQFLLFEASIEDPDGDMLHWRVFVDYFAASAEQREPDIEEVQVEPDLAALISFTVDPSDPFRATNPHSVELYVADRPFDLGLTEVQGRDLEDPEGLTDTFVWTINLDPGLDDRCQP